MAAIGASRSDPPTAREIALSPASLDARQDAATPGEGGLHRLLNRVSSLDLLIADAGPLGKYRADAPDQMPSGTSALTLKVSDSLNRLAARLGLPGERILSGNPSLRAEPAALPPAELPQGSERTSPGLSPDAPRPADPASADNRAGHIDRGNRAGIGA